MDLELSLGQMEQNMKDNGKMIKYKDRESLFTLIKISMRANSLQAKQMDMVSILRKAVKFMKEYWKTINHMVKVD